MAKQTTDSEQWESDILRLHSHHTGEEEGTERDSAHRKFWDDFWDRSHIWVSGKSRGLGTLTRRYAETRYLQAIQTRTWVPIKFNGELFTAQLPPETQKSGPTYRKVKNVWLICRVHLSNLGF